MTFCDLKMEPECTPNVALYTENRTVSHYSCFEYYCAE